MKNPDNKLPEIRIKNAWLLRTEVSEHLNTLWGDGKPLEDHEYYEKRAGEYEESWKPYEKIVLDSMTKILGLDFRQNIIAVYIAPWMGAFSDPMVIGVKYSPDEFIDTLTHELLHRLLTDNIQSSFDTYYSDIWTDLFGKDHSHATLVHIPVHAVHKAIYLDILKAPERLQRDIDQCKKWNATAYLKAWEYVDEHGYEKIIQKLKDSYSELQNK